MRFIHIADLHIGKQLNDISLLEDQKYILDQIAQQADAEKADAVLIAGDVYQRSSPQAEAMALFDAFITRLTDAGKKVFIISGNHDSALRISYFSSLLKQAGVYVSEQFEGTLQSISLKDADGEIVIHLLPFLRPSAVKRWLPEEKIITYQDAVEAVLRNSPIDKNKRNILLCHQFITGCETSESEEKTVGGLDQINASVFDGFDYVALGHIHKPQHILRDTLRYAGSPLCYSFSETGHKKCVTLADVQEKGRVTVKKLPLYPLHEMRTVEGMLSELLRMDYSEDYVWVTVHDEIVPPDARVSLGTVFPNMMKFSVVNSKTKYDMDVLARESMENKTVEELFCDFYRLQNNDQMPGEMHLKVLTGILKEMEADEK